ncbi:transcription initiation factor IIB family protein [Halalkalicoccus sp. NIPERK01]|uniref:transcription initiation factor IIB family protein n=1 Tax=Halalkalicoccus sp. NIPERK01 TaxID=3053469 RepID=UPI00256F2611|nr:transcription initiation factor IIB family protein [Halalkalicoccus sp. NIPERK01]
MYRASDRVRNERWLADLGRAADDLDIGSDARSVAEDLFLSTMPDAERSKPAAIAASLYAGGLIAGDRRSQGAVAEAVGVTRLTVQNRWKPLLEEAGLDPPTW